MPFAAMEAPGVLPSQHPSMGVSSPPMEVSPRSDQQRLNRPARPSDDVLPTLDEANEVPATDRQGSRDGFGSDFVLPTREEDDGNVHGGGADDDAPQWQPLRAPAENEMNEIGHTTLNGMKIELGQVGRFPIDSGTNSSSQERKIGTTIPKSRENRPVQVKHQSSGSGNLSLKSTNGRAVEMVVAGQGSHRILVIGSLYGNDPESLALVQSTMQALKSTAPKASTILVMKTANPDGLSEHMATNAKGVDLNRNFPSTWFPAQPTRQSGPHPASEIETQNLMRVLQEFQPDRVIHVHDSIGHRPLLLLNSHWIAESSRDALPKGIDIGSFQKEFKVGSIEEFVSVRLGKPMATIQLPPKGFERLAVRDLVQIATVRTSPRTSIAAKDRDVVRAVPSRNQASSIDRSIVPENGRVPMGIVEILPPPPESGVPEAKSKYYELPPPPDAM